MTNNNLYCFTGGPSSGKTSVLNALHKKGFKVIQESARQIIKQRRLNGHSSRPEPLDFAIAIFNIDLGNYLANSKATAPVFFDRSHIDAACMIHQENPMAHASYESHLSEKRFNPTVFLFPPWEEIYQNDDERDQSYADAVNIFQTLSDWYKIQRYDILEVPRVSISKRAEFVSSYVLNIESSS